MITWAPTGSQISQSLLDPLIYRIPSGATPAGGHRCRYPNSGAESDCNADQYFRRHLDVCVKPSRDIRILRAVRTFGNGDKVSGIVAVYATAVHHVGRDLLLCFALTKLIANQMTGRDCGLG